MLRRYLIYISMLLPIAAYGMGIALPGVKENNGLNPERRSNV